MSPIAIMIMIEQAANLVATLQEEYIRVKEQREPTTEELVEITQERRKVTQEFFDRVESTNTKG